MNAMNALLFGLALFAPACCALRGASPSDRSLTLQGSLLGLELINAKTNLKVADLVDGTVIVLDEIPGMIKPFFNINATYTGSDIASVGFTSNVPGRATVTENASPYALCLNNKADFFECASLGLGNYTVSATPYSQGSLRGTAGATIKASFSIVASKKKSYFLPNLTYAADALEPYIDTATMNLHHGKHHAGAVTNLNKATENSTKVSLVSLMEKALEATPIRNNGGSHYNHALFWDHMAPFEKANQTKPSDQLSALLNASFGGLEGMKTKFNTTAGTLFGSGWVWLCVNQKGDRLEIVGTPNQDNPLMKGVTAEIMFPILGLDVWEHAYYLKHQNRRPDYIKSWWYVVDWTKVSSNCAYVIEHKSGVAVQG